MSTRTRIRADFMQRQAFRRLCRLNNPRTLGDLRSLYRSAISNPMAGAYSGYAP